TFVNGLYYKHTTGGFSDIDLIDWNLAEFEGVVPNFTLSPRTQEDYFNFQFEGYLYINTGGSYQFRTSSDDGSRLAINDVVNVDNDGLHGPITVTGASINLNEGPQFINVKYFDYTGGQTLVVRYKGPDTGNNWVSIPDAALRSGNNTSSTSTMMASAPGTMKSMEVLTQESAETQSVLMDIYPNPIRPSESMNVVINGSSEPVKVKLMDLMGKSYYEKTFSADDLTLGTQILPTEQLIQGIYIMVIHQGNKTVKQKVIVKE
ncbi:MAG: PA14 domain-containing protein, partial [Cyclobacteriaceae bacterium]